MDFILTLLIGFSLAVDCFAVSLCISSCNKFKKSNYFLIPLHFGLFQALMVLAGYYLGVGFQEFIEGFDHWIAFGLLSFIGIKFIFGARQRHSRKIVDIAEKDLLLLSLATSIDALAVGIALSIIDGGILSESFVIGVISLSLSLGGLFLGRFGKQFNTKYVSILAGSVLIGIGLKVVLTHLLRI